MPAPMTKIRCFPDSITELDALMPWKSSGIGGHSGLWDAI